MAKQKSMGLGRGLDAIFADSFAEIQAAGAGGVLRLPVDSVRPNGEQPRTHFDEEALAKLADSLRKNGMLQPVMVRRSDDGGYLIVAGERRWRAAVLAGLKEIPVLVVEADDRRAYQFALIENLQRVDLDPLEEAASYRRLTGEYGMTQEEVSVLTGRSIPYISNTLRLLRLPDEVKDLVREGRLSAGHARALLGLNDASIVSEAAREAVGAGLSVREIEAWVKKKNEALQKDPGRQTRSRPQAQSAFASALAKRAADLLGHRVALRSRGKHRMLQIEYTDDDDLNGLLERLCGQRVTGGRSAAPKGKVRRPRPRTGDGVLRPLPAPKF